MKIARKLVDLIGKKEVRLHVDRVSQQINDYFSIQDEKISNI